MAIKMNPGYVRAYIDKGNVLRHLGKVAEALDCFDMAIKMNPGHVRACLGRALVLRGLGRVAEATRLL